ncbi:MAG: Fic family protein, partial [Saprospiraceae bacterium]
MKNFKSGIYRNQGSYKSFQPNYISRKWLLDDMEIIELLSRADRTIGRLDMYSNYIPNIELFISMHLMKEATESTKIEGTQTNMEEALLPRNEVPLNKRDDWDEVRNYITAMNNAIKDLETLPFSSRLIRKTHRQLLQDVRGKNKLPGEFRRSQNWIGGATLKDAIFIPPTHTDIPELMGDLEQFVHDETHYFPELLKIALVHYQFETIHPFLDGNGRVGRLMITLYLVSKGILKQPILYLSDFFEKNRHHYFDNLMYVRTQSNIKQWFKFFLVGVIETAKKGILTFDNILQLQKETDLKIQNLGSRSSKAKILIEALYINPLIDAEGVSSITKTSKSSAYTLIKALEQLGILKEISGGKRHKLYLFERYVRLF